MASRRQPLLGQLLIKDGLITKAQLDEALRARSELRPYTPFEQILVEWNVLPQAQLNAVLDRYHKKHRLGSILVETKVITDEQLRQALQYQQKTGMRLGDALLKLNLLSDRQMKQALCRQFDVAFVDLDTVTIDRRLTELVPAGYARQRRVIPIARVENRLTVAMDDPADLDVVEELAQSTRCAIEVVTSTTVAFQRAFLRTYEDGRVAAPAPPARGASERPPSADAAGLVELRAAEAALLEERTASAQARRELEARQADTERALAELERRHREAMRALEELRAAHEALVAERDANAQTFRELAVKTLAELEAAQAALRQERLRSAQALRELEVLRHRR